MIEYLKDCILASCDEDITIQAVLQNSEGDITNNCYLIMGQKEQILLVDGSYNSELGIWTFNINKNQIEGLNGKFWYQIFNNGESLDFKKPIYLVGGVL